METWILKNYHFIYKIIKIMEEKIIRPTTKPEAVKGKLLKYKGTDYCEFMPQAQGEPQYEGMCIVENGHTIDMKDIIEGYKLTLS